MLRRGLTAKLEDRAGARFSGLTSLPLPSKIALLVLALIVALALFAPLLAPMGPLTSRVPVVPPGAEHWFGTDAIGRDIFARVAYGARSSLLIGVFATLIALAIAAVVGSLAATSNKVISEVIMRILDIIMSFPGIALAAVFVAVFGNSLVVIVGAIAFLYIPQLSRVVRANVLAQFGEDYVSASRVMGARTPRILVKHVARNCLAPVMVFATVLVADAIILEASLSFINAGVRPPEPSWGNILAGGQQLLLAGHWWATFFPGLMILITVLALNVLAEGLTDALASPKVKPARDIDDEESRMLAGAGPDGDAAAPDSTDDDTTNDDTTGAGKATDGSRDVDGTRSAVRPLGVTDAASASRILTQSLDRLRTAELERGDRLVYPADRESATPLLSVENLSIAFPSAHGDVDIVDDVSFSVRPGEVMGLVGESGCGKSITSLAVMGLLPDTARVQGRITFDGQDLLTLSPKARGALRGHDMAMIYQDALSSLNPSMLIRTQMAQLIRRGGTRSAPDLLEMVGLDPKRTLKSYPHELSGGQRQRVLIAMALTRDPRLVMADEPTTALDVTVQEQVVGLLQELREELGFAMVFVSHDLALVAKLAHRITVMYAGQVVEQGTTTELLTDPRHEYTRGLLGAVLSIESEAERLHQVPGTVPSPREFAAGDRFAPRSLDPDADPSVRPHLLTLPGTSHAYATTDTQHPQGGLR